LVLVVTQPSHAETVEVAKDVRVTKKTFAAPINEQPFFGFAEKTPDQKAVDDKFVVDVIAAAGSREKAFDATVQRGWALITKGSYAEAAKRFNQAYLLRPEQSAIYHSFAVIAVARFNDQDFADELFKQARKQPAPLKALSADYGRFLLIAKRPKEALPMLEQATVDSPDFADAWSNLAFARLQTGDTKSACDAVAQADKLKPSVNVAGDLNIVRRQASCS
jgi:Tfp pilus assembly protein PilF